MNIVLSVDDNYVVHLCTLIRSIEHYNSIFINYFVLHHDVSNRKRSHIETSVVNGKVHFIEIDIKLIGKLPLRAHFSSAIYSRLLIGEVIPAFVDRVLYLDSDIIANGDLYDLWNADLGEYIIGACQEMHVHAFNSGVMLIDLSKWRNKNCTTELLELAINIATPKILDQEILNKYFKDKYLQLPSSIWNFQPLRHQLENSIVDKPRIIHFTTMLKPWNIHYRGSYQKEYLHFRNQLGWSKLSFEEHSKYHQLKQKVKAVSNKVLGTKFKIYSSE